MKAKKVKILPVRIYGDETLRKVAKPVVEFDDKLRDFVADLTATMYKKDGVGLAAPQVGISLRIFVVDPDWFREGAQKNPHIFINPEFKEFVDSAVNEEGCLSLPGIFEKINNFLFTDWLDHHFRNQAIKAGIPGITVAVNKPALDPLFRQYIFQVFKN